MNQYNERPHNRRGKSIGKNVQTRKCNDTYDMNIHNIVSIQLASTKGKAKQQAMASPRLGGAIASDQKPRQAQGQLTQSQQVKH